MKTPVFSCVVFLVCFLITAQRSVPVGFVPLAISLDGMNRPVSYDSTWWTVEGLDR